MVSYIIQSSPLSLEMENPRPDSGWLWLLRLVLSSHLAVPRCGLIGSVGGLTLISPPSPSSHKGLKMAYEEAGHERRALWKGRTGPAELGPPSQNQPWDLHTDECVTCPGAFQQLWLPNAGCPDVSAPGVVNKSLRGL